MILFYISLIWQILEYQMYRYSDADGFKHQYLTPPLKPLWSRSPIDTVWLYNKFMIYINLLKI